VKLSLEIPEAQAEELRSTAARLGVTVEQLAQAAIADLTSRSASDFEGAARRVLKNRGLYGRLA
jgi:hypothetical protein